MDKLGYIISQDAPSDCTTMGGKAAALAEMNASFSIPDWFVISPKAFLDCLSLTQKQQLAEGQSIGEIHLANTISDMIVAATAQLAGADERLAVRSSATAEDGKGASFAGQLDSYLNVTTKQVPEKVKSVWSSAFTEHVRQYRKKISIDEESIPAVIVQRMVKADLAGVAFSVDPVTFDQNTCVINATGGLADKLVSGEVNGDTYHMSKSGKIKKQNLDGKHPLLSQDTAASIVDLVLKAEAHFQLPQDIEWAIQDGKLYLLQSRPITTLKASQPICEKITLWDNSNIVESYSGVTSPLTFSFARYVYEHVYIEFCQFMGVPRKKVENENNAFRNMLGFVGGHVYYNLVNWYRVLALFPGFTMNRTFMEQMMGVKEPLPDSIVKSIVPVEPSWWNKLTDSIGFGRTLIGLVWHQIKLPLTIRRFYERLQDALSSSESLDTLSLAELGAEYRVLESKLLKKWDAPLINDFLCMIAFGLSRKLLEKYAGQQGLGLHNDIMIGQGDIVSAEPAIRIRKMADIASKNSSLVEKLIQGDLTAINESAEFNKAYQDYLNKFGDRCLQELKLESLTLHDNPVMLLQAIGHMARREKLQAPPEKDNDIDTLLAPLFNKKPIKRWFVSKIVAWAKARVRDRENLRFERTRVFGRVRHIFLAIGHHFHDLQYIKDPRDIFLLEISEIMGLIEGTATIMDIGKMVEIRAKQQDTFQSQASPPNRFEVMGAAFPAFINQNFHTRTHSAPPTADSLQGIGCCQGVIRARVKVIRNPHQAELKPGEIMVAEFTDPGWITLFANASGILVERGSLLSHSAIVAREMGIPAIVAIDGVMTWLNNGDVVEMNGTTGIVSKIRNQSDHDNKE